MIAEIIKACSIPLAMLIVGFLAWHAISNGIDGAIFMTAVVVIGGLGGYEVKSVLAKREEKKASE
ncbi:unnamed protein product [marine sediment metagenome]|uniref:Uncharacterized protein n=1 Tax=marine sediment metagenome TaxID=412755 RepID=X1EDC8_9ZZZZ